MWDGAISTGAWMSRAEHDSEGGRSTVLWEKTVLQISNVSVMPSKDEIGGRDTIIGNVAAQTGGTRSPERSFK